MVSIPAKWFICPDGQQTEITHCLANRGCRLGKRCATRAYLRLVGFDREFKGVSPSSAGNGERAIYLKVVTDYAIDPDSRAWAAFGTSTHAKLGIHKYNEDILSEEPLKDDRMRGIPDVLEEDECKSGYYILTDYKTWGSFKTAKAQGIILEKTEKTILDGDGRPVILKSGKNKGKPKTKKGTIITIDTSKIDLRSEENQLNRYRVFFEIYGFPISRTQIQVLTRDGGTWIAKQRGIERNITIIPIKRLETKEVVRFYDNLQGKVDKAFETGYAPQCNAWESWDYRRCEGWCEVAEACKKMSHKHKKIWGII